jgi:RNA-binding protein 25
MKPFITKRVREYLGQEDPDMIEFVLDVLKGHPSAKQLEEELREVMDEAVSLVTPLWRMLILETESRARGLV